MEFIEGDTLYGLFLNDDGDNRVISKNNSLNVSQDSNFIIIFIIYLLVYLHHLLYRILFINICIPCIISFNNVIM